MDIKEITSRDVDFAQWYTDVCMKADLVDYSSVKGSMIIRPLGYAIWENIQSVLDKEFKKLGHENVQMPMLIPESLLNVEKEHVEGFAPEVAWVTHGGSQKLEERFCIRPTSEVLFCEHYKKIIKTYRDLPKLYNQWCTIVRWEKTTRPFLRSREIMWQEGHTMHRTSKEAINEAYRMFDVYKKFQEDYLALPVITGKKTEKEKFAGAEFTLTLEAMMYNGYALQNGTSHYFGNHFADAFGIKFTDEDNTLKTPYQTSWGVTTRMIGAIIMTHGDDRGLVLPPRIAPTKVMIIPIGDVFSKLGELEKMLSDAGITYKIDDRDKTPGFRFADSEVKGYPVRVEFGKRDLDNGMVTLVRRDTLEKIVVSFDNVVTKINELLENIQSNLFNKAKERRDSMIHDVKSYDEINVASKSLPGFLKINWCGSDSCEDKVKEDFGYKTRCLIEDEEISGNCAICGKKANKRVYIGRQY